jgi:predicted RNA-binding Zn-ribbon protein involved in translation (DUF1610 family)
MILDMPDDFTASAESVLECPACGGAGGGPHGRAGSAWDDESYVCPRCEGQGVVREIVARPLAKGRALPAALAVQAPPASKKSRAGAG